MTRRSQLRRWRLILLLLPVVAALATFSLRAHHSLLLAAAHPLVRLEYADGTELRFAGWLSDDEILFTVVRGSGFSRMEALDVHSRKLMRLDALSSVILKWIPHRDLIWATLSHSRQTLLVVSGNNVCRIRRHDASLSPIRIHPMPFATVPETWEAIWRDDGAQWALIGLPWRKDGNPTVIALGAERAVRPSEIITSMAEWGMESQWELDGSDRLITIAAQGDHKCVVLRRDLHSGRSLDSVFSLPGEADLQWSLPLGDNRRAAWVLHAPGTDGPAGRALDMLGMGSVAASRNQLYLGDLDGRNWREIGSTSEGEWIGLLGQAPDRRSVLFTCKDWLWSIPLN